MHNFNVGDRVFAKVGGRENGTGTIREIGNAVTIVDMDNGQRWAVWNRDVGPEQPNDIPRINIKCETRGDSGLVGTCWLDPVRVEPEDDGSFTVVTHHWPANEIALKDRIAALESELQTANQHVAYLEDQLSNYVHVTYRDAFLATCTALGITVGDKSPRAVFNHEIIPAISEMRSNQLTESHKQQAHAWCVVNRELHRFDAGLSSRAASGVECAIESIRHLAERPILTKEGYVSVGVSAFRELIGDEKYEQLFGMLTYKVEPMKDVHEIERLRSAVRYSVSELKDKEHVARCRGDEGLANYYKQWHEKIEPTLGGETVKACSVRFVGKPPELGMGYGHRNKNK